MHSMFRTFYAKIDIIRSIEYMAGRSSGRYLASHPSWFRKQRGTPDIEAVGERPITAEGYGYEDDY